MSSWRRDNCSHLVRHSSSWLSSSSPSLASQTTSKSWGRSSNQHEITFTACAWRG